MEPQINADERRFVKLNNEPLSGIFPRSYCNNSPQSSQRTQRSVIMAPWYGNAQRLRTRIMRIFTDLCVSASTVAPVDVAHTYGSRHTWRSVFHHNPSAFICVHLRLNIRFKQPSIGFLGLDYKKSN